MTHANTAACPRCKLDNSDEAAYCEHCGANLGEHKPVPWYHLHRRLYDWVLAWAYRPTAAIALFVMSFAESSFFPVPPDVLLMPLVLGHRKKWLKYATICSVASVLGGIAGYFIGMYAWAAVGDWALQHLAAFGFTKDKFDSLTDLYKRWDFWIVFTAGFTPLPFKLITITAGVSGINFPIFVFASVVSRSARFFLVSFLMHKFGPKITPFVDKYFNWLALLFTALLIGGVMAANYLG
jgi:membrane protein YqaA with SNARE-associated domain